MKSKTRKRKINMDEKQIEMLRKAGFTRRFQMAVDLSQATFQLSWMGFSERYSHEPLEQRKKHFIKIIYDDEKLHKMINFS